MALRIIPGQANMVCGDCEHLLFEPDSGIWFCSEAPESLVLNGWPRMDIRTAPDNSAESCPSFDRDAASRAGESVNGWDERDCAETHRRREGAT